LPKLKVNETFDLHYDTYDFTDPWTSAETLVLVHGNTRNSKFWYWYLPRFAAHYKVVTLDWRGHGQSPPPPGYKPNLADYVEDIIALLDHLWLGKIHYVSEATGSVIGCQLAANYPARVKSLTMTGPGPANGSAITPFSSDQVKLIENGGMIAWTKQHTDTFLGKEFAEPGMYEWYAQEMAKEPAEWDSAVKRWLYPNYDIRRLLPKITAPTLLQIGENTPMGLNGFKEMARLIPNCELMIYFGAPHYTFMSHRQETLDATLQFLRRVSR
jgi:3-oxoadipate enol-lactonase